MKKISIIFVAVFVVAGLASYAFADPGWSNGHRNDNRYQHEQPYRQYDQRDYRDYRDHRGPYYRPAVVHRVPFAPPRPVVRVYEPPVPGVSLYFPNFSITFR